MKVLVLFLTIVGSLNASRPRNRHNVEVEDFFSDGIDPAPDIVHGEANRVRAQEPLEGHSSVQKKLKANPKHRPAQNVPKGRGDPSGDFGRDTESTTRSSSGSKSGERRDSVTAPSVPQVVVYVKNPPKSPLRAQVIKELVREKPLPTLPLVTTAQEPAKPENGALAPPPPPPEPSVPSPGYPKAESQKESSKPGKILPASPSPPKPSVPSPEHPKKESPHSPTEKPQEPPDSEHKGTSPLPPAISPPHSADNESDNSASEHEGTDSDNAETSEEDNEKEKKDSKGGGHLKEGEASSKTVSKGNPPSYPVAKEQIHSPSASKADQVVSSTMTTVPPEAYQHPRGKTRSTLTPTPAPSSPVPPTSKPGPAAVATTPRTKHYVEAVPESHGATSGTGSEGSESIKPTSSKQTKGGKEAEAEVAPEEQGGGEGYNVDHKASTETSSTEGGVESAQGKKDKSGEQNGDGYDSAGSTTEIEATGEAEAPIEGENPYGNSGTALKQKKTKEDHTGHTSKQEEAEEAYNKSIAESEAADESGENPEDTDKTSRENEPEGEYEPENGEHQPEKAEPIPNHNEAEGEHEHVTDEPAEKNEYAPEEPYGSADHGKAEGKVESGDSGYTPEKAGTASDEKDKSVKEEKQEPSGGTKSEEETDRTSEKATPASNKKETKNENKENLTGTPEATKSSKFASAKAGKENGHNGAKQNYKESTEVNEAPETVEETNESEENTEPSSEVTDGKASYEEVEGNESADGEESQSLAEGNYGSTAVEDHVDMAVHSSVPVVRVDSKTKDHDIVIAYTPNRTGKPPSKAGRGEKRKDSHHSKTKSSSEKHHSTKGVRYINVPSMDSLPNDLVEQQGNLLSSIIAIKRNESVETEWTDESPESSAEASSVSPKKAHKHKARPSGTKHSHVSTTPAVETESPELDLHSTAPPPEEVPNLHKDSIYTDFPRPEELPITIVLTKEEAKAPTSALPTPRNLSITKFPGDLPRPEIIFIELPGSPVSSNLDETEELASSNSTVTRPRTRKPPHKSHPSGLSKPKGIKKNKPKKELPNSKPLSSKKNITNFPRPKKLPVKKVFSKFPRLKKLPIKKIFSNFPRPESEQGTINSTESPVEGTSLGAPELDVVPIIEPSVDPENGPLTDRSNPIVAEKETDSSESTTTVEEIPEEQVISEEKSDRRSFSEFPRPGYLGMIPSFLKLTGSGRVVQSSKFAVPSVKASGDDGGVTIFLSSNFSTDESDTVPQLRPILINVPHPQPLPLNVTITRRTVRKLRKTHKKQAKPQKDDDPVAAINNEPKQPGWKVKMVPKSSLEPVVEELPETSFAEEQPVVETLPEAPSVEEPIVETITDQTITDTEGGPLVGESIDEPASEKSQLVDETIAPLETTTFLGYVTAPGERTAAPEVLAAQVAQDSLLATVDRLFADNGIKPIELRRSPQKRNSLENLLDEMILETTTEPEPEIVQPHRKETPKTSVVIEVNLHQNWMELPYYDNLNENTDETSLDLVKEDEKRATSTKSAHVRRKQSVLPFRNSDEPLRREIARKTMARIFQSETSTKAPLERNQQTPHGLDCSTEVDEKGVLCENWARGGLCRAHRPTMFLFCRKTCLCGNGLSRY